MQEPALGTKPLAQMRSMTVTKYGESLSSTPSTATCSKKLPVRAGASRNEKLPMPLLVALRQGMDWMLVDSPK